jgi:hypothetical protein
MPRDCLAIRPESVIGAKLYADRYQMLKNLGIREGAKIAEIGVAHGELSDFLIREIRPSHFYAIDLFDLEKLPVIWGIPQEELFKGKTHYDFYRDRFSSLGDRITVMRGLSAEMAANLPDASLDMIYIDAGHDYGNVVQDGAVSARKIKRDGVLVFNDYVLYDPFTKDEYGVVPAIIEMLNSGEWQVIGFAMQRHMFCDIAIKRA